MRTSIHAPSIHAIPLAEIPPSRPGTPGPTNSALQATSSAHTGATRPVRGDGGRSQALGLSINAEGIPTYTDTIKSKRNSAGERTFSGRYGIVKSLVEFSHREEMKAGVYSADNSLHALIGENGLQITFTAQPEIKAMLAVLKAVFSPTEVSMMRSKSDRHVEKKNVEGDVLTAMLFDQLELGGAAFGSKTLTVPQGDEEAGNREVTIPEYLQTFALEVKCENPEVSTRILNQLQGKPELVADMQAELILNMENKKGITKTTTKGFALSALVSAGTGALYEYVISQKLLKPLLPGAKKFIKAGEGTAVEVGKRVIDAAPHLLSAGSKVGAVAIDAVPPGAIEVLDTPLAP